MNDGVLHVHKLQKKTREGCSKYYNHTKKLARPQEIGLACTLYLQKIATEANIPMSSYHRESNFHLFRLHRAQKLTFQFPCVVSNIIEIVEICTLCPDCVVSKRKNGDTQGGRSAREQP
jgi:hypothetical protein